jgi:Na+-driven multidrug efflux pump
MSRKPDPAVITANMMRLGRHFGARLRQATKRRGLRLLLALCVIAIGSVGFAFYFAKALVLGEKS